MAGLEELIWSLRAKSIRIHSYDQGTEGRECIINMFINSSDIPGWENLIERLNAVFGNPYRFVAQKVNSSDEALCTLALGASSDSQKTEREVEILAQAVINNEFKLYPACSNKVFDIKLGISCNNNCTHCVIKPNVRNIKKQYPESVILDSGTGMQCSRDLSFPGVIDILGKTSDVGTFVLTGGEPTIRKDFPNIIKWIYFNRPHAEITLQTNGRNLSDKGLVRAIRRYTRNPSFAVAIHGLEETHNSIVNNRKEAGNPFKETAEGIRNLIEVFDSTKSVRTEMVLTNQNINDAVDALKFQYEKLGVRLAGVSYPHFSGFPRKDIKKLAPDLSKVLGILDELNKYAASCGDLSIFIEEVPFCVFNQLEGEIVLRSFENRNRRGSILNFMGSQNDDFHTCWVREHAKFRVCKDCVINNECLGIWQESRDGNEKHVVPISNITPNMGRFLKVNWGCEYRQNDCSIGGE